MSALRAILREFFGLFVDDGALAVLVCLWVAAAAWILPLFLGSSALAGLFFVGLAAILAVSVTRA